MADPDSRDQDPFRVYEKYRPYDRPRYPDRELLVSEAELTTAETALRSSGLTFTRRPSRGGIVRVQLDRDSTVASRAAIDTIRARFEQGHPPREAPAMSPVHTMTVGQPNVVGNPEAALPASSTTPLPPLTGSEGEGVTVAIIDTGIEPHDWLGGQWDALDGDFENQVLVRYQNRDVIGLQAGHGVFLAGLVLRHAPAARILVLKTANSFGESDIDDVAAAILEAGRRGADVINLSLGCYTERDREPWTLRHALNRLRALGGSQGVKRGIAVVASAGNSAAERRFWPGAFPEVTAVGALAGEGVDWELAEYTNRGGWVDVYVPATNVHSTYIQYSGPALYPDHAAERLIDKMVDYRSGWATWSGTSMASAIWSGVIARSITRSRESGGPAGTPAETARILLGGPGELEYLRRVTVADVATPAFVAEPVIASPREQGGSHGD